MAASPVPNSSFTPCRYLVIRQCGTSNEVPFGSIAGVGTVESNFLQQTVESIKSFSDPDLPALLVILQYLTQLEGPMWRQIRGMGLSYHYNISLQVSEGLMYFVLFKSTHVLAAYKEAQNIVEKHINGEEKWDEALLESSRSSLIFELIERVRSVSGVVVESMLNYFRGVDKDYSQNFLKQVAAVTVEDLQRVAPIHLKPLFDVSKSRCAVCCHPSKVQEVVQGFKELNRDLTLVNLEENNFLSKLK
jgi:Zn-dependent M16 (insulinase) family peptidase